MNDGTPVEEVRGRQGSAVRSSRLGTLAVFQGMELSALERISAGATEIELPAGAALYRRGDASNGIYYVIHGMLKLCLQAPQGAERVVEMVGPGGYFGETTLIGESVHMLTAEVVAPTQLVHISRAVMRDELSRTPAFARWIIASLTERLNSVIRAFEDCTLRTGPERVAGYLVARVPAGLEEGRVQIELDTKKGTIASQLNLTQEHFSRILRDLSSRGLIEVRGRLLIVADVARLKQLASSNGIDGRAA